MKNIFIYMCVAVVAMACTKSDVDATAEKLQSNVPTTIRASIEGLTRTELHKESDSYKTYWSVGDQIAVYNTLPKYQVYKLNGDAPTRNGSFSLVEDSETIGTNGEFEFDKKIAFYPKENIIELFEIEEEKILKFTTPNVQSVSNADTYSSGTNAMIAIAESGSTNFSFENVLGYLKITLKGSNKVKNIVLSGNNSEIIAGTSGVVLSDTSISAVIDDDENNSKTITLDCGDGIQLTDTGVSFIFALPPISFDSGITITAIDVDDKVFRVKTSNNVNIVQNVIQPMTALDVEFVEPYGIVYTADTMISTNNMSIVSHNFNNGTGYINILEDYISDNIFKNTNVTSVVIPEGITMIKEYSAFSSCELLTSITLPNSLNKIRYYTFAGCSNLDNVTIPEQVTYIDNGLFQNCTSLRNINILGDITYISVYAFQNTAIESITLPDTFAEIGGYAFSGCKSLKSVTIQSENPPTVMVNSQLSTVFSNCHSDMTIYVPSESIAAYKEAWPIYAEKIQAIQ